MKATAAEQAVTVHEVAHSRASLRLVADGGRLVSQPSGRQALVRQAPVRTQAVPRQAQELRSPVRSAPVRSAPVRSAAGRTVVERAPVRLTRRGRIAVTAAAALLVGAVSMTLAGAAQATGRGDAHAGPGAGVTKVEVRPGQSMWSIAEAYDPDADTRVVIQEMLQLNSLTSDQLQPGQLLWVPRG